mmetsp:Transcript_29005/g.81461  ORF Transcript_29005/g.81461 Transcript_29005/m.81461 type:complete len:335 (-) Transcript_29005:285-1289(-)
MLTVAAFSFSHSLVIEPDESSKNNKSSGDLVLKMDMEGPHCRCKPGGIPTIATTMMQPTVASSNSNFRTQVNLLQPTFAHTSAFESDPDPLCHRMQSPSKLPAWGRPVILPSAFSRASSPFHPCRLHSTSIVLPPWSSEGKRSRVATAPPFLIAACETGLSHHHSPKDMHPRSRWFGSASCEPLRPPADSGRVAADARRAASGGTPGGFVVGSINRARMGNQARLTSTRVCPTAYLPRTNRCKTKARLQRNKPSNANHKRTQRRPIRNRTSRSKQLHPGPSANSGSATPQAASNSRAKGIGHFVSGLGTGLSLAKSTVWHVGHPATWSLKALDH